MAMDINEIKKDRLRYTKNTLSANLTYVAILFNVLYFVSIYSVDVGNYYYNIEIGVSVLCNLIFLLIAFLASEGLKNYKMEYSYIILGIGVFQLVRIMGIPMKAHNAMILLDGAEIKVMDDSQFTYVMICLVVSAIACFVAGVVGLKRTITLNNYVKEKGLV